MIIVSRIIHVKVDRRLMSQINSNIKDDFKVVLLLSCFVGHPVHQNIYIYLYSYTLNWNFLLWSLSAEFWLKILENFCWIPINIINPQTNDNKDRTERQNLSDWIAISLIVLKDLSLIRWFNLKIKECPKF